MRKDILASSLILLFIGIVTISVAASIRAEVIVSRDEVKEVTGSQLDKTASSWSISGKFSKGRKLRVVIQPGELWRGEPAPGGYAYLELPVSIYDPQGGQTNVTFVFTQSTNPFSQVDHLQLDHVELEHKSSGLTFEETDKRDIVNGTEYYRDLAAIVEFDGTYKVTIFRAPGVGDPPSIFKLESLTVEWQHPYLFAIVVGGCLIFAALVLLWIGKIKQTRFRGKVKTSVKAKRKM